MRYKVYAIFLINRLMLFILLAMLYNVLVFFSVKKTHMISIPFTPVILQSRHHGCSIWKASGYIYHAANFTWKRDLSFRRLRESRVWFRECDAYSNKRRYLQAVCLLLLFQSVLFLGHARACVYSGRGWCVFVLGMCRWGVQWDCSSQVILSRSLGCQTRDRGEVFTCSFMPRFLAQNQSGASCRSEESGDCTYQVTLIGH